MSAMADRMPMPAPEQLTAAQRDAVRLITDGPRGAVVGPFVPLLRSPELMTRLQLVGEFLRFGSGLPDQVLEQTILQVARYWDQAFEWGYHYPLARRAGLEAATIDDIGGDRAPAGADATVRLVWESVRELLEDGALSETAYQEVLAAFGESGLIELVVTVGYYTTLALVMNSTGTEVPPGLVRLPPREDSPS